MGPPGGVPGARKAPARGRGQGGMKFVPRKSSRTTPLRPGMAVAERILAAGHVASYRSGTFGFGGHPTCVGAVSRLRGAVSQRLLPLATHAKDAPSLRCAKLGVASAETATPIITPARYLFIRTMSSISLQVFPRTEVTQPRGNRRLRSSALRQACVPPSKERLQKCHPMRRASGKAAASLPIALSCYSLTEKV
jgi:hypothetical protein